ncbi:MAG TPA: GTPase, partial [Pirellulales bacterium]
GREEAHPLDRLDSIASLDLDGRPRADAASITVRVHSPWLASGLVLIDTPGVGEQERQTRRAVEAVAEADLVLLVLDARQLLGRRERELAGPWMSQELRKPVAPVLNFLSQIDPGERKDVRAILERWSRELPRALGRPWFEVDALTALRCAVAEGPAPEDDFSSLRSCLAGLTGPARLELQRGARRGQLLADLREARLQNNAILGRLQADAARLGAERAQRRHDLESFDRRFALEVSDRRATLSLSTQRRFDDCFRELIDELAAGQSQAALEAHGATWYAEALSLAVRETEKEGETALLALTFETLDRPEPLTVAEQLILKAKLEMGALSGDPATALWLSAKKVVDYLVGVRAGEALAAWLGWTRPPHVEAYRRALQQPWREEAERITQILLAQFDARVLSLEQQLARRLAATDAPAPVELATRRRLQVSLEECRRVVEETP